MKHLMIGLAMIMGVTHHGFGAREMARNEVLEILERLTEEGRTAWIVSGRIRARHVRESYIIIGGHDDAESTGQVDPLMQWPPPRGQIGTLLNKAQLLQEPSATDAVVVTHEAVDFAGDNFLWTIDLESAVGGNGSPLGVGFELEHNRNRVFAWDGQLYTSYFTSANYAIITESPRGPVFVDGPIRAGFIPWGHGTYQLTELAQAELYGQEYLSEKSPEVHIEVKYPSGQIVSVTLDPSMNYATLGCAINQPDGRHTLITCDNYRQWENYWIPSEIVIEQYQSLDVLQRKDTWYILEVSSVATESVAYSPPIRFNTQIEYFVPGFNRSQKFHYTPSYHSPSPFDSHTLLMKRLRVLNEDDISHNCASIAMRFIAETYNINVSDSQISELTGDMAVSFKQMQDVLRQLQLHSVGIRTTFEELPQLENYRLLLHLPGENHYILLDRVDSDYIYLIDLLKDRFHYRLSPEHFKLIWPDGLALVISDQPIESLPPNTRSLSLAKTKRITGQSSQFGGFDCLDEIQAGNELPCSNPVGGCIGMWEFHYTLKGCKESADPDEECIGTELCARIKSRCIDLLGGSSDCSPAAEQIICLRRACDSTAPH